MRSNILKLIISMISVLAITFSIRHYANAEQTDADFIIYDGLLVEYRGPGGNVIIPDTVTRIGEAAFYKCEKLTGIVIPDTVTSIGYIAFFECKNLSEVTLSSGLQDIGTSAFGTTNIKSVSIPDSVYLIGNKAFSNTPWLTDQQKKNPLVTINGILIDGNSCKGSVTIPDTVVRIGDYAFYENDNLTEVTIPDTVTEIGDFAFGECSKLKSISIPDTVGSIGMYAFTFCTDLTKINLSNALTKITFNMFSYCNNLKEINLPDSVISIEESAFENCKSLTSITIPNRVNTIGKKAFRNCTKLRDVKLLGSSLDTVGDNAFEITPWFSAKKSYDPMIILGNVLIDGRGCHGEVVIPEGVISISDFAFQGGNSLNDNNNITSIIVADTVKRIGKFAFADLSHLTSIELSDSVAIIEHGAFSNTTIESIILPKHLTVISPSLFEDCEQLTDIIIPASVQTIGSHSFHNTLWLENKQNQNALVIVNDSLVDGTRCKGDVILPNTIKEICKDAFRGNTLIKSIVLPSSVTTIGAQAFYGCTNLKSVQMGEHVSYLGEYAFSGCTNLSVVGLSDALMELKNFAFEKCTNLRDITISQGIVRIGYYAFGECVNLQNITIPETTVSIDKEAFRRCSEKLTIYGTKNSLSQLYADYLDIRFQPLSVNQYKITLLDGFSFNLGFNSQADCIWISCNEAIATVTQKGKVVARGKGTALIKAVLYDREYTFIVVVK